MVITAATESHIPQIVELWKEFEDFHAALDPFFSRKEDGHIYFEKILSGLMKSNESLVLVAVNGDDVVGFSTASLKTYPPVYINESFGFIGSLSVKSGWRRKGIGEQMLGEMLDWFKSRNIERVELRVRVKNEEGYSFWKKHGFQDYEHYLFLNNQERARHC